MNKLITALRKVIAGNKGTVYLIHFETKLHHAAHYIGWARHVTKRLEHHKAGRGARILNALNQKGISYEIVRKWGDQDRNFERKLKNQKNAWRLCPVCKAERKKEKPEIDQGLEQKVAADHDDLVLEELFDGSPKEIEELIKELVEHS